jgi:hypothetical protein
MYGLDGVCVTYGGKEKYKGCLINNQTERIRDCPLSNMLLCRGHTQQRAYDVCLFWSVVTFVGQHKND